MFSELNKQQREAVEVEGGPLLIVAGAGSGKTKTLTARLAYLIAHRNIEPRRIIAITFTNKAAQEMKERVISTLDNEQLSLSSSPFVGTFHSFGAYVLRHECYALGRKPNFTIYDRDDSLKIIKTILKNQPDGKKPVSPPYFLKEFSRIKSELLSEQEFWGDEQSGRVWNMYQEYEKALMAHNAFDFDDLIQKVVALFEQQPAVLAQWQSRFDHILVDEYQDVNTAQYRMVSLLAAKHHNITVVGDDQQSIYKFRFSDFRNFLNFEKNWPSARVVLLEQNYRSTKTIVSSASFLISHNEYQKPKTLWTDNDQGKEISIEEHDDEFAQADVVARLCQIAQSDNKRVGVLFRTNAQSRALEHVFLDGGVEYALFGALSFYDRKEIKDLVAMLRIAFNPQDGASIERLLTVFYKKKTAALVDAIMRKSEEMAPGKLLEWLLKESDYASYVHRSLDRLNERMENISELVYFASQFQDLTAFMEQIALASPLDKRQLRSHGGGGVSMMTVHLAKGLEFDVVHLVGVNEGLLPHQQSLFSSDEIEEERRLMYVAMTRARQELYLHFHGVPSRFLGEIPGNAVSLNGAGGGRAIDDEERYIEYD